jgi:hypothetical protein
MGCLKRFIAREVYQHLARPNPLPKLLLQALDGLWELHQLPHHQRTCTERQRGSMARRDCGSATLGPCIRGCTTRLLSDVFVPEFWTSFDEVAHHRRAHRVIQHDDLDTVVGKPVLPSLKGLCFTDDDA